MSRLKLFALSVALIFCSADVLSARKSQDTFYFGVFPYVSGNRIVKLYKPIATYLEQKLEKKVVIVSAPSFKAFLERTHQQKYDLIFTAPHFAALEEKRGTYSHLARFERNLKGNVFVSQSSPIKTPADLIGKKVALPDELAVISAMGEFYIEKQGLTPGKDVILVNTPSHINALLTVKNQQADAGIVAWPVYNMFTKKQGNELRVIAHTDEIVGAMFMLSNKYLESDYEKILEIFLSFSQSEMGKEFFKRSPFKGLKRVNQQELDSLAPYLEVLEKHL